MRNKRVGNGRERVMTSWFAISHLLMAYGERCKELEAFNTSEQPGFVLVAQQRTARPGPSAAVGGHCFGGEPETCTFVTA